MKPLPNFNLRPTLRQESEYVRVLLSTLRKVYAESSTTGQPVSLIGAAEFIALYARQAAARLITGLLVSTARTWRQAAAESMQYARMHQALSAELSTSSPVGRRYRQLVREQAILISTFPSIVARRAVAAAAAAQQQSGGRPLEFSGMGLLGQIARPRALLIARTQLSKASTALTEARSEELDLPWYIWETSSDGRVRLSHRKMQGVLCRFDNPPAPEILIGLKTQGTYNAGNIYNCRCFPRPLLRLDQVSWPHRVYTGSSINRLSLAQFKRLNTAKFNREVAA